MNCKAVPTEALANPAGSRSPIASNSIQASTGEEGYNLDKAVLWGSGVEAVFERHSG